MIAISNVVPIVRGTLTVPTAMSRASGYRFPAYSLAGSVLYVGTLVALAAGLEGLGTVIVR